MIKTYTKMRNPIVTILILICSVFIMTDVAAQVGIGTVDPTNTLHVKPRDQNADPLRLEDLNQRVQGDSALLVVDPSTGLVRFMHIDSLAQYLTIENDLQSADEVPLNPNIDIDTDGIVETNVQEALEKLGDALPKGTFRSIGDARSAGLTNGDSFWADPRGVFGCSGCVITLHPGMN